MVICKSFKEGCEQTSLSATKKGETAETPGPAQRNLHSESYSWIPTVEGGYCCGFNGVSKDLGEIVDTKEGIIICPIKIQRNI